MSAVAIEAEISQVISIFEHVRNTLEVLRTYVSAQISDDDAVNNLRVGLGLDLVEKHDKLHNYAGDTSAVKTNAGTKDADDESDGDIDNSIDNAIDAGAKLTPEQAAMMVRRAHRNIAVNQRNLLADNTLNAELRGASVADTPYAAIERLVHQRDITKIKPRYVRGRLVIAKKYDHSTIDIAEIDQAMAELAGLELRFALVVSSNVWDRNLIELRRILTREGFVADAAAITRRSTAIYELMVDLMANGRERREKAMAEREEVKYSRNGKHLARSRFSRARPTRLLSRKEKIKAEMAPASHTSNLTLYLSQAKPYEINDNDDNNNDYNDDDNNNDDNDDEDINDEEKAKRDSERNTYKNEWRKHGGEAEGKNRTISTRAMRGPDIRERTRPLLGKYKPRTSKRANKASNASNASNASDDSDELVAAGDIIGGEDRGDNNGEDNYFMSDDESSAGESEVMSKADIDSRLNNLMLKLSQASYRVSVQQVNQRKCDNFDCGGFMEIDQFRSVLQCADCGACREMVNVSYEDSPYYAFDATKSKPGSFKPNRHYEHWITHILARESELEICDSVGRDEDGRIIYSCEKILADLRETIKREGIVLRALNVYDMRRLLQIVGRSDLNKNAPLLIKKLTGIGPPEMSEAQMARFENVFCRATEIGDRIERSSGRVNRNNYPYTIFRILEALIPESDPTRRVLFYVYLQNEDTIARDDADWEIICRELTASGEPITYKPTDSSIQSKYAPL